MKNAVWGLALAFQFLTRIPIPVSCPWNEGTSRWALRFYPIVGFVIGGVAAIMLYFAHHSLAIWVTSLLVLSVWTWLTGGLHLDGWMDIADAAGSNAPFEKKMEILKDPRVGSFAVICLVFLLLWKLVLIHEIASSLSENSVRFILISIIFIPGIARFGAAVMMYVLPGLEGQGLASAWKRNLLLRDILIAFLPLLAVMLLEPMLLLIVLIFSLFILLFSFWIIKVFRNVNGDALGAAIEGGELAALAAVWLLLYLN
jgi:adenosylcobinamide-GDP ribazoletransferase